MTAKQYKYISRRKCVLITKLIMSNSLFLIYVILYLLNVNSIIVMGIMTYGWIHGTDIVYHYVENRYKLKHDKVSYK